MAHKHNTTTAPYGSIHLSSHLIARPVAAAPGALVGLGMCAVVGSSGRRRRPTPAHMSVCIALIVDHVGRPRVGWLRRQQQEEEGGGRRRRREGEEAAPPAGHFGWGRAVPVHTAGVVLCCCWLLLLASTSQSRDENGALRCGRQKEERSYPPPGERAGGSKAVLRGYLWGSRGREGGGWCWHARS